MSTYITSPSTETLRQIAKALNAAFYCTTSSDQHVAYLTSTDTLLLTCDLYSGDRIHPFNPELVVDVKPDSSDFTLMNLDRGIAEFTLTVHKPNLSPEEFVESSISVFRHYLSTYALRQTHEKI